MSNAGSWSPATTIRRDEANIFQEDVVRLPERNGVPPGPHAHDRESAPGLRRPDRTADVLLERGSGPLEMLGIGQQIHRRHGQALGGDEHRLSALVRARRLAEL